MKQIRYWWYKNFMLGRTVRISWDEGYRRGRIDWVSMNGYSINFGNAIMVCPFNF